MKIEIKSKKEYHEMMVEIYNLMNKGEGKLTKIESSKLSKMAMAAELYEENIPVSYTHLTLPTILRV